MQGGLIAVAPYAPRLSTVAPAFQLGLIDGLKQLGQALRSLRPDLFVVNSAHSSARKAAQTCLGSIPRRHCAAFGGPSSSRGG
jgi:hypothetical protein